MINRAMNILLVEDNPADARLVQEMLAEANGLAPHLERADRLSQALTRLRQGGIDVVLLDLSLPDSHGLDTLRRLRAGAPEVTVIGLTGHHDESAAIAAVEAGAEDYLVKGRFDREVLTRALRYAMARQRAEAALTRERDLLSTFMDNVPDLIYFKDAASRFLRVNRAQAEVLGVDPEEAVGKTDFDFFTPEHAQAAYADEQQIIRTGRPIVGKLERIRTASGKFLWVSTTKVARRDSSGQIVGTFGVTRDISEARRAQGELEQFFMLAQDMLCIAGFDGYVKRISPVCEKIFGYTPEEVQAQPFLTFVHPEEHPKWLAELQKLSAGGVTHEFESRARCRDGSYKWILWNAAADLGEGLIYASGRDITERKEAELASQALLASIVQSSEDAIIGKDLDGRIVSWNKGAERIYGYTAEEVLGKPISILMPSGRAEELAQIMARLKRGEAIPAHEADRMAKGGKRLSVSVSISPLRDADGRVTGASAIARDITEQKRAEAALQRNISFVKLLQRVAMAANQATSVKEAIQQCLELICAHIGCPIGHACLLAADPAAGLSPTTLWHLDPGASFETFRRSVEAGDSLLAASLVASVRNTGRPVWAADTESDVHFQGAVLARRCGIRSGFCFPVLAGTEVVGVLAFFSTALLERDDACLEVMAHVGTQIGRVVERQRAEDAIRKLNEDLDRRVRDRTAELEAINKELEAFTYSVSHDLRAPLRHIDGFSKILMDEYTPRLPPEAQKYLERVRLGAQHMGRLVDDLLRLARVGRQGLALADTSLDALVHDVIQNLQGEASGRQVEWKVGCLPRVTCDPALIKQVFQNLLSNALKYTRTRPQAVIEVNCASGDGEDIFVVRDNGVGFDMKYADKLYGVFQRLHRSEDFEGTGVGLAIVQRIIHKHGGRVWAEAEPDKGAAFFFTLGPWEGA